MVVILVGKRIERARNCVQREREREREKEVVASVVTATCGEDREHEVVASVNSLLYIPT